MHKKGAKKNPEKGRGVGHVTPKISRTP